MPHKDDDNLHVELDRPGRDAHSPMHFVTSRQIRGHAYRWGVLMSAHPTNEELIIAFTSALDSFSKAADAEQST